MIELYGYPLGIGQNFQYLDKYGKKFRMKQYGLSRQNRIISYEPDRHKICYQISTLGGQSGSALIVDETIIAIHNGSGKYSE